MSDKEDLSDQEIEMLEQDRIDRRQDNQRKMAWIALASMLMFTVLIFVPFIENERIKIFVSLADLFYLAQAGIVSAYMGSEAIVNRSQRKKNITERPIRRK